MEQISLFDNPQVSFGDPLANRLRPRGLEEYIGQEHLLGAGTGCPAYLRNLGSYFCGDWRPDCWMDSTVEKESMTKEITNRKMK